MVSSVGGSHSSSCGPIHLTVPSSFGHGGGSSGRALVLVVEEVVDVLLVTVFLGTVVVVADVTFNQSLSYFIAPQ